MSFPLPAPDLLRPVIRALLALWLAAAAGLAADAGGSAAGVVCFGDSITLRGYPQELGRMLDVAVVNAGVGGNTTVGALRRLQRDVLAHRPRVVVVLFGTNDSRLDAPKVHVPVERYLANLREIVAACRAIGAHVVLGTVPPIAEEKYFTRHARPPFEAVGGLGAVLEQYRSAVRALGAELGLPVVELHTRLAATPQWLSADGVHPTAEGNVILARLVAEAVRPLLAVRPAAAGARTP